MRWWPWSRGKGAGKYGGGSVLLGDLLIEVGERVFDAEDVHQLLGKGAGDGAIEDKIGQLLFHSIALRGWVGDVDISDAVRVDGERRTIGGDDRWAASRGRAPRRFGPWRAEGGGLKRYSDAKLKGRRGYHEKSTKHESTRQLRLR